MKTKLEEIPELTPQKSGPLPPFVSFFDRNRAILAFIFVYLIGVFFAPNFFTITGQSGLVRELSRFGILAAGMTFVIITGGIDLSVGSILGLNAVLFSILVIRMGIPWPVAILMCLALGAFTGFINGLFITSFKIQPFVATLAMMVAARGFAKLISGQEKISTFFMNIKGDWITVPMPKIFLGLDGSLPGTSIPVIFILLLLCIGILWFISSKTPFGRYLYAIGGNEDAALLAGVRVRLNKIGAYIICGMTAALAGICQAAAERQGDPESGSTYELMAIAMVVIGGTPLIGGEGGVKYTLLGAFIIGCIDKILSLRGVSEAGRLIATGVIIIGAVLIQFRRKD